MSLADTFGIRNPFDDRYEPGNIDISRYTRLVDSETFDRFHRAGLARRDIRPEARFHVDELLRAIGNPPVRTSFDSQATTMLALTPAAMRRPDIARLSRVYALERGLFGRSTVAKDRIEALLRPGDLRVSEMMLPPLDSSFAYAITLHEFGHAFGHMAGRTGNDEFAASQWAVDNARYWNRSMTDGLLAGLWTYVANPSPSGRFDYTREQFTAFVQGPVADRERRG